MPPIASTGNPPQCGKSPLNAWRCSTRSEQGSAGTPGESVSSNNSAGFNNCNYLWHTLLKAGVNKASREREHKLFNKQTPARGCAEGLCLGRRGVWVTFGGLRGGMSSRNARREMLEGPAQGAGRGAAGDGSGARSAGRGRARHG